jgi:cyclohexyl-isocyanide hydratase
MAQAGLLNGEPRMKTPQEQHLHIGAIVFPKMDQMDFTGPFEVLSRIPNSTIHVVWKDTEPIRDVHGLILTPDTAFTNVPRLDVLVVPGGAGQQDLMGDDTVLSFLRQRAGEAQYVFSVCTGALLCGAAGLLRGIHATTHWSALHLLKYFGAIPVKDRVVLDGKYISAAGVTAGLDGALRLAAILRDDHTARQIQLSMEYAPAPPFRGGSVDTTPREIVEAVRDSMRRITDAREATARRVAAVLGITTFSEGEPPER